MLSKLDRIQSKGGVAQILSHVYLMNINLKTFGDISDLENILYRINYGFFISMNHATNLSTLGKHSRNVSYSAQCISKSEMPPRVFRLILNKF